MSFVFNDFITEKHVNQMSMISGKNPCAEQIAEGNGPFKTHPK